MLKSQSLLRLRFIFKTIILETEFKKIADKALKNKNIQNRKKIIIFSICLVVSLFFWTLKKFSKDYQLTLQYKVNFQNFPSDKVLVNNSDSIFFITFKSQGFDLIYYQLFKHNKTINIDCSENKLNNDNKLNISYLGANQILKNIKKQNDFNFNVINLFPDTFALKWEKAYYKKVRVIPVLKFNFAKQYQIYDSLKISPDSIYISGTLNDLNQIQRLYTQAFKSDNLRTGQTVYLKIIKPKQFPKVKLFAEKIKIQFSVEKFTESEIEIPVTFQDDVNFQNVKLFPDKVKIKYLVALKDFKKINPKMFIATVNTDNLKLTENKAKIQLIRFPENIKILSLFPEKTEFIIFK